MEIQVLRPSEMTIGMIDHWRALQEARPSLDSPFLSPDWPLVVERAQAKAGRGTRVAILHDRGRTCGFLGARVGAFTAMGPGSPLCDYQGLVAEPGTRVDPRALVQALGVGRFDFTHLVEDQDVFRGHVHGGATSWIVDVSDGYEAYARARREAGGPGLKPLDKKRRKAERELGPVVFTPRSASAADFAQLFAWKRAQLRATGQIDIFAPAWPLWLMQGLFAGGAAPLTGLLFTLHIGGRLAAAHFHLAGRRTLHAWMIAHCASFERYSPGLLLFQDILKWTDETAFERLDLGLGDYRFKRELANTQQTVAHGFVGVPSPAAFLRSAAYGVRDAAERWPLGAASAVPGKAMRRLDVLRALN